jgi:NAD-dependent DNA ligase
MTLSELESDQRFILAAGYAYNTGKEWVSDATYDAGIHFLQTMRDRYPDLWNQSSVYPEVFIEDEAWTYTSQHFPQDDVVRGWYEDYRSMNC